VKNPAERPELFTIGHSTHPLDVFLGLLARHGVEALADIRRFPGSRKYPHFHRDSLASALPKAGVEYRWFESLGGRRKKAGGMAKNLGMRNESFRNYADYMATPEFQEAAEQLLELAGHKRTAFMCSEGLFWRCHRRLVSDYLLAQGFTVQHIMPSGELRPHTLTEGARVVGGEVSYPPPADQGQPLSE
jgi:uncharacterized protein (DUF488 family)